MLLMQQRWALAKACFDNPLEKTPRLVLADFFAENGMKNAEQRQREYASLLERPLLLRKYANNWRKPHKSLFVKTKKDQLRELHIKPDGEIIIEPNGLMMPFLQTCIQHLIRFHAAKQCGQVPNGIDRRVAELILWVQPSLLKDVCEATGVKVTL